MLERVIRPLSFLLVLCLIADSSFAISLPIPLRVKSQTFHQIDLLSGQALSPELLAIPEIRMGRRHIDSFETHLMTLANNPIVYHEAPLAQALAKEGLLTGRGEDHKDIHPTPALLDQLKPVPGTKNIYTIKTPKGETFEITFESLGQRKEIASICQDNRIEFYVHGVFSHSVNTVFLKQTLHAKYPDIFGKDVASSPAWLNDFCRSLISEKEFDYWVRGKNKRKAQRFFAVFQKRILKNDGTESQDEIARTMGVTGSAVWAMERETLEMIAKAGKSFELRRRMKADTDKTYEEFLNTQIDALPFSERSSHMLTKDFSGSTDGTPPIIKFVLQKTFNEILRHQHLGKNSANEIKEIFEYFSLHLLISDNLEDYEEKPLPNEPRSLARFRMRIQSELQLSPYFNDLLNAIRIYFFYATYGRGSYIRQVHIHLHLEGKDLNQWGPTILWDGHTLTVTRITDPTNETEETIIIPASDLQLLDDTLKVPPDTLQTLKDIGFPIKRNSWAFEEIPLSPPDYETKLTHNGFLRGGEALMIPLITAGLGIAGLSIWKIIELGFVGSAFWFATALAIGFWGGWKSWSRIHRRFIKKPLTSSTKSPAWTRTEFIHAFVGIITALASGTLEQYLLNLKAIRKLQFAIQQALGHIRERGWLTAEDFYPGLFVEFMNRMQNYSTSPHFRPASVPAVVALDPQRRFIKYNYLIVDALMMEQLESILVHEFGHFTKYGLEIFLAYNRAFATLIQNGISNPEMQELLKHAIAMHVESEYTPYKAELTYESHRLKSGQTLSDHYKDFTENAPNLLKEYFGQLMTNLAEGFGNEPTLRFLILHTISNPFVSYLPQLFEQEIKTGRTAYTDYVDWVYSWLNNPSYYQVRPADLRASQALQSPSAIMCAA